MTTLAAIVAAVVGLITIAFTRRANQTQKVDVMKATDDARLQATQVALNVQGDIVAVDEKERATADAELSAYLSSHPTDSGTDGGGK